MSHWVDTYIGQPWVNGENDCWAFFRKVQRSHFGRHVPAVDIDACNRMGCMRAMSDHDEHGNWYRVDTPQDGDAVLMSRGKHPSHIGVWVEGGVLHSAQGVGVTWQKLMQLRRDGWIHITLYRHK